MPTQITRGCAKSGNTPNPPRARGRARAPAAARPRAAESSASRSSGTSPRNLSVRWMPSGRAHFTGSPRSRSGVITCQRACRSCEGMFSATNSLKRRPELLQQAPAAVAARVDLHGGETELAEPPRDGVEALLEPGNPVRLDLDAGALPVMADPEIAGYAKVPQVRFGPLDLIQAPGRDLETEHDPAREAPRGRRVPRRQPELARRRADFGLRHPDLGERRTDSRALPGGVTRTMLLPPQVLGVCPVACDGESPRPGLREQPPPQLRLAEETPVGGVGAVVRIVELVGVDLDQRHVEALRHGAGSLPLGTGVGGAPPNRGDHPIRPQLPAQHHRQEGGIDPP